MKVFVGFLLGVAVGMWAFIFYFYKPSVGEVLSLRTQSEPTAGYEKTEDSGYGDENGQKLSLATVTEVPSETPTPTVFLTSTPEPTSTPKITATPTPQPQPVYNSQEINGFVDRFAGQYGVDPNVLRAIAICESGFNASKISRNGQYAGLYQFSANTWKTYRKQIGEDSNANLRLNAEEAVQTAAYALSVGRGGIWPNCMP